MTLEDPEGIDLWEAMKLRAAPLSPEEQARLDALMKRAVRPLSPGDPRRHHFIPQFFQKRFATKDERLLVVPLGGGKRNLRHVTNIAVMVDLYMSVNMDVGETAAVETLLAEVDGLAAGAITRLVAGTPFPPERDDRDNLAIWLALLYVRDPQTRRRLEALSEQTYKLDLALGANPDVARDRLRNNLGREPTDLEVEGIVHLATHLDEIDVREHQSNLVKLMLDSALAMTPHIARRKYLVMRFPEPGLLLSDRPVVLYQRAENREPDRAVGVINADEILLPLDRSTVLVLHNESQIGEVDLQAPSGYTVQALNQILISNAAAEVYCHPDDEGELDGLEFPDPDQPLLRAEVGSWFQATIDGINAPPKRKRHHRWQGGAESDAP